MENKGESDHFLEVLENSKILEILEIHQCKYPFRNDPFFRPRLLSWFPKCECTIISTFTAWNRTRNCTLTPPDLTIGKNTMLTLRFFLTLRNHPPPKKLMWSKNRTGENRTGEPRPSTRGPFREHLRGSLLGSPRRAENREMKPRGALVGALVGGLVGPLVDPLVGPFLGPLVGQISLSPALFVAHNANLILTSSRTAVAYNKYVPQILIAANAH